MNGSTGAINAKSLLSKVHSKAVENSYCQVMSGISSAELTIFPFAFGKVVESGTVYRKFFYNSKGKVVKKFCFDKDGNIEMRESYEFNTKGKNLHGHFITDNSISQEKYVYNDKGLLTEYLFRNQNWETRVGIAEKKWIPYIRAASTHLSQTGSGNPNLGNTATMPSPKFLAAQPPLKFTC